MIHFNFDPHLPGGRPSHLIRRARYESGGREFESQCLRRDRLILDFSKGVLLRQGVCLRMLTMAIAVQ